MTEVIPPTGPRRAGGPAGNGTHPPRPAPVRADFSPAARASRPPCPHGGRDFSRVRVRHGVGAGRAAGDNARSLAPPERRMADLKEARVPDIGGYDDVPVIERSEEHTSELQSLMRISYAVFCLKKKTLSTN